MKRWSFLVLALLPATGRAAVVDSYVLLTSTGRIGTMKVTTEGKVVDVDWRVDDNGRGPKIREHIVLGTSGLPVRREIEGTAMEIQPFARRAEVQTPKVTTSGPR
jgi:hypothetical protein